MSEQPTIAVPNMCQLHQQLLVAQLQIGPLGPWRVVIVGVQIVLFQGTTAHPDTYHRIGHDVTRIGELGCLACFRPDVFGEAIQAYRDNRFDGLKALGERLIASAVRE